MLLEKKKKMNLLTSTCSPVLHQSESCSAVALSYGVGLVGALVEMLGERAQLWTASVVY